jgi:hypothetical protein
VSPGEPRQQEDGMSRTQTKDEAAGCAHEPRGVDGTDDSYADWQRQDLLQRAHELDINDRVTMTRLELIEALRQH